MRRSLILASSTAIAVAAVMLASCLTGCADRHLPGGRRARRRPAGLCRHVLRSAGRPGLPPGSDAGRPLLPGQRAVRAFAVDRHVAEPVHRAAEGDDLRTCAEYRGGDERRALGAAPRRAPVPQAPLPINRRLRELHNHAGAGHQPRVVRDCGLPAQHHDPAAGPGPGDADGAGRAERDCDAARPCQPGSRASTPDARISIGPRVDGARTSAPG